MEPKDLAKMMKGYRERNGLTQGDLAKRLAFTQATISRIEAGIQNPRPAQIKKIAELVWTDHAQEMEENDASKSTDERGAVAFLENYANYAKSGWNSFKASRPHGSTGGDVVLVKELKKNSQLGVLVGDSVGHGATSTYMSFALEFAYNAIASALNPIMLSPEFFDKSLALGIVKTARAWRGEPSMIVLQVDMDGSFISLINRGMPYPILLDGDKSVYITRVLSEK